MPEWVPGWLEGSGWRDQLVVLAYVALAGLLGGLVGWERERADKPAGLRTHILVAAAAALVTAVGELVVRHYSESAMANVVRADPTRILHAIVLGVSFLGAGTIVTRDTAERVTGLTTAASVLLSTGIGMTVALGELLLGIGVTLFTLVVLRGVRGLEARVRRRGPPE